MQKNKHKQIEQETTIKTSVSNRKQKHKHQKERSQRIRNWDSYPKEIHKNKGKTTQKQTTNVVDTAIENGITLFDTADVYGGNGKSEIYLGKALSKKRHDVVIATKFGAPMGENLYKTGASRKHIMINI